MRKYTLRIITAGLQGSGKTAFLGGIKPFSSSVAVEKTLVRDYWSFETSYERSPVLIDGYDLSGDENYDSILLGHLHSEGLHSKFDAKAPGVILWFIDATRVQASVDYINQKSEAVLTSGKKLLPGLIIITKTDLAPAPDLTPIENINPNLNQIATLCYATMKDHIVTQLCSHEQRERSRGLYNYTSPPNKVAVLGAPESGKTALLHYARHHQFLEDYQATVGANVIPISLKEDTTVGCLDMNGAEVDGHKLYLLLGNSRAIIFCVDVSSRETINRAAEYLIRLRCQGQLRHSPKLPAPICIVFTKTDKQSADLNYPLIKERLEAASQDPEMIQKVMGETYDKLPAIQFMSGIYQCSAKDGTGVDGIFDAIRVQLLSWPAVTEIRVTNESSGWNPAVLVGAGDKREDEETTGLVNIKFDVGF